MGALRIGVDFDGTIVQNEWPRIGEPVPGALGALHAMQQAGALLVLWTRRTGHSLDEAVQWLGHQDLRLHGINKVPGDLWAGPKPDLHLVIDDAALGCPRIPHGGRLVVDWSLVLPTAMAAIKLGRW